MIKPPWPVPLCGPAASRLSLPGLAASLIGQAEGIPQRPNRNLMEVQAVAVAGYQGFDGQDVMGDLLEKNSGGFGLLLQLGGTPFV